jgi:hypothetical protein
MALVLLCLILFMTLDRPGFVVVALVLQVVTMTVPSLFRPAAVVWFGVSRALGAVMSPLLLGAVYVGLVAPVGIVRRALGKDDLRLRAFGGGNDSVLTSRDHTFTPADLERPY